MERDPHFALAHFLLFEIYAQKKMPQQMDQAFDDMQFSAAEGLPLSGPAAADALIGRIGVAREGLQKLLRLQKQGKDLAYSIAVTQAALGNRGEAFRWLDVAYNRHNGSLILLKRDPAVDALRDDPRFLDLLKKMRLG